ncbi:hypothetical protein [Calidithermus roseus]|uniref:Uncharacterized protein n=1 Tax=Calidithermus roseus TaxID=1644118 RepID=A0A399EMT4_9DEIN|nr:hypothetical protein [Calidithermus roseus]RIH84823.1 hypothetical protein Mrose_02482 [Calidithermus roseus]
MKPPLSPGVLQFWLSIRPETAEQPWHATLENRERFERVEFDSPLELARHLAHLGQLEPKSKLR